MAKRGDGRAGQGFSVVELLIVLVVGAIVMAIAAPQVARSQRRASVRTAADEFVATHGLARSMAIKYGRLSELHIDNATSRIWVQVDTGGTAAPDTIGAIRDLAKQKVRVKGTRSMICFDASGGSSSRGSCGSGLGVYEFASGGYVDTVRVTAGGNVLR